MFTKSWYFVKSRFIKLRLVKSRLKCTYFGMTFPPRNRGLDSKCKSSCWLFLTITNLRSSKVSKSFVTNPVTWQIFSNPGLFFKTVDCKKNENITYISITCKKCYNIDLLDVRKSSLDLEFLIFEHPKWKNPPHLHYLELKTESPWLERLIYALMSVWFLVGLMFGFWIEYKQSFLVCCGC